MDFQYICYTSEKQLVKGKLIAPDEDKAVGQLNSLGYQVISIKSLNSISKLGKSLNVSFTAEVKPKEVIMFSRQMALLLESGIDVVTAIDLFRSQARGYCGPPRRDCLLRCFSQATQSFSGDVLPDNCRRRTER